MRKRWLSSEGTPVARRAISCHPGRGLRRHRCACRLHCQCARLVESPVCPQGDRHADRPWCRPRCQHLTDNRGPRDQRACHRGQYRTSPADFRTSRADFSGGSHH